MNNQDKSIEENIKNNQNKSIEESINNNQNNVEEEYISNNLNKNYINQRNLHLQWIIILF